MCTIMASCSGAMEAADVDMNSRVAEASEVTEKLKQSLACARGSESAPCIYSSFRAATAREREPSSIFSAPSSACRVDTHVDAWVDCFRNTTGVRHHSNNASFNLPRFHQ